MCITKSVSLLIEMMWLNELTDWLKKTLRFTTVSLSKEFQKVIRSFLNSIVAEKQGNKKFCTCWLTKLLTDGLKTCQMVIAFEFLKYYRHEGENF